MATDTMMAAAGRAEGTVPPTVSGRLAAFVAGIDYASLPAAVQELAKLRMLDGLAAALPAPGLKVPELARALVRDGRGPATVIGYGERLQPADAAFVNATLVNGRSQDDFLAKSHAGALTIPAALALAESTGRGGAEVLASLVAGYEVTARAYLGGPEMLPRFRASGVAGTVGAAAAAARMLRLDPERTMHALGTAACFAHGFGQGFLSGTTEVKLNVGMASRNGVSAALLAAHGATASPLAFEGEVGFFRAFANGVDDAEAAVRGLGERFLIEDTVYKECPVCIFAQTPIALGSQLAAGIAGRRIDKAVVRSPLLTHTNPGFTNVAPFATRLQAVVSARFCTAAALLGRPVASYDFYDAPYDEEVLALAGRIELAMRPEDAASVEVEAHLAGGEVVRAGGIEMDTLRPTAPKVIAKFRRLAGSVPGVDAEAILALVMELDRVTDIRALTALLAAPR